MINELIIGGSTILTLGSAGWLLLRSHSNELRTEFNEVVIELHERIDTLEALVERESLKAMEAVAQVGTNITNHAHATKEELKTYFDAHKEELKQNAYALKVHAQQLQDEAQARNISRTVPTRGQ